VELYLSPIGIVLFLIGWELKGAPKAEREDSPGRREKS
jgi:hypothetical protein